MRAQVVLLKLVDKPSLVAVHHELVGESWQPLAPHKVHDVDLSQKSADTLVVQSSKPVDPPAPPSIAPGEVPQEVVRKSVLVFATIAKHLSHWKPNIQFLLVNLVAGISIINAVETIY